MDEGTVKDKDRDRNGKEKQKQEQDSTGNSRELLIHSEGKKKELREILEGKDGKEIKGKTVQTIKMWFQSVPRLERPRMPLHVT